MQVLVLAGGRGVRLRPLTSDCPKPLLALGDRPILTHIVAGTPGELLITVIVAPGLEEPFRRWQSGLAERRRVRLYVEPYSADGPLGPVRALAACVDELEIDDDLLILMGDSLLPFALQDFFAGAAGDLLRLAAYRLPDLDRASRFGVIEIGPGEMVERFEEKPARPRSPWVFTGCLYIPRRLISALPRAGCDGPANAGDLVAEYLRQGERIQVFRTAGDWHDIGTFESYLEAHRSLLTDGRRQLLAAQGNRLRGAVYVHSSAQVAGSVLQDCVVMANARVLDAELIDCVVQPGTVVVGRTVRQRLVTARGELSFTED